MPDVSLRDRSLALPAIVAVAIAALLTSSCGSSSETQTVTMPSAVKCQVQLQTDSTAFPSGGGSGTLRVTTNRECAWSATTDAAWVTVAAPAEGQGDGAVAFTVVANGDAATRNAGISVNDQRLQISQAGTPCEFTLSSNRESIDGPGGDLAIQVRASAAQCTWTAAANVAWITIVSGRDGHGTGTVNLHVDPVTGPPRTGTLTIAGQTLAVEQGTGCTFAIGSDTFAVDASGGERQVPVSAPPGCAWTAESRAAWITIEAGSPGSGPGAVAFRVAATEGPSRSGTLTVAGRTVTVTQSPGCGVTAAPASLSAGAQEASSNVQIATAAGCTWSATSSVPWITLAGSNGTGSGQLQVTVAANTGPARTGSVTVGGQTIAVTQDSGCAYTVTPASMPAGAQGSSGTIQIATATGCTWSAASGATWITIAGGPTGSGPGQLQVTVAANTGPARNGSVSVAGRTVSIAQESGCMYSVSPTSVDISGSGGIGSSSVATTADCPWTASSGADWITLTSSSGTGPSQLAFTIAPNPGPPRTGSLTLAGRGVTVNQGSPCTWTFAPPSHDFDATGGGGNVLVLVTGFCTWTATSTVDWIRITAGGSGSGNGLLQFTVPPNTGPARSGVIVIAGQNYVVRQAGQ